MLRYTSLLILLFSYSCGPTNKDCLTTFESQLTTEQSQLFTELTERINNFIRDSNGNSFAKNYRNFLTQVAENEQIYKTVPGDIELAKKVIQLDTMIFRYEIYTNETGEQRRFIQTFIDSDYILALKKVENCSDLIGDYVNTIQETGGISPALLASGVSQSFSDSDFNNPVLQRILAVELYLPFLTHQLEEKRL